MGDLANKDKTVALSIVLDIVEMAYQGADPVSYTHLTLPTSVIG